VEREPTSPLFVRLPTASAEKLNRAAFELKTPKRELVTDLVERNIGWIRNKKPRADSADRRQQRSRAKLYGTE